MEKQSKHQCSVLFKTSTLLLWLVLMLGNFAVVILFVQSTYSAEDSSRRKQALTDLQKLHGNTVIGILRALQGILASISSIAIQQSFVLMQWIMVNNEDGLSYYNLLALEPTVTLLGTAQLVIKNISVRSRVWAILRVGLVSGVWVSGVALFFRTSTITVFDTSQTYNVTAGVGPFNGSYVQSFIDNLKSNAPSYPYQILPYNYYGVAYYLVINPLFSTVSTPVRCRSSPRSQNACMSYLLSGGLEMVAPWTPLTTENYPLLKIENVTTVQLDFTQGIGSQGFAENDCDVFGAMGYSIGVQLCFSQDASVPGLFNAGIFTCNGTNGGTTCNPSSAGYKPNITTAVSFYQRRATMLATRSNYSISAISDLTEATQIYDLDIQSYRASLRWLLNFTADGIPPPSAIVTNFWGADDQLQDPYHYGVLLQNFQSIVAFPIWLFNANNFGNIKLHKTTTITPGIPPEEDLPPEFYTNAAIVSKYEKIKFDLTFFVVFLVLQGLAIVFVLAVLLWIWICVRTERIPELSSFSLFDTMFKSEVTELSTNVENVLKAESSDVLDIVKGVRVYMRKL